MITTREVRKNWPLEMDGFMTYLQYLLSFCSLSGHSVCTDQWKNASDNISDYLKNTKDKIYATFFCRMALHISPLLSHGTLIIDQDLRLNQTAVAE